MSVIANRHAQRYLMRAGGIGLVAVAAPGVDPARETGWRLEKGRPKGTFNIIESTPPHRLLAPSGTGVLLASSTEANPAAGRWRLEPVGDGSAYQYVVDASDPSTGLQLSESRATGEDPLTVSSSPISSGDPAAMWLLSESLVADARSIHLRYPAPAVTAEFYNSITPYDTPPGTYFCVAGFGSGSRGSGPSGYAGIQKRGDGSTIAIFSLWHRMRNEITPRADARAIPVDAHPAADQMAFGGEGSGVSVRVPCVWPEDGETPIRFALGSTVDGADTLVSAYIGVGRDPWTKLGTLRRIGTGGRLLSNPYSFAEDFLRNGATSGVAAAQRSPYRARRALFHDPWVRSGDGSMDPVQDAAVTAYGPHPLENLSVSPTAEDFGLVVSTGGSFATIPTVIGAKFNDSAPWARKRPPPI